MKKIYFLIFILLTISYITNAQIPYNTSPVWISSDNGAYSTGCAWVDLNKDGWLDLVTADGNDMARQKLSVYYSNNGTLPAVPSGQSTDIDYNGKLSIGDVNGDGWPDVAVSVYIGPGGFGTKGKVKLYLNNNGILSSTPDWISGDSVYTFSCAFGDADGDGDLDLAAACGESYDLYPEQMRIYYNNNGVLSSLPGWKSAASFYALDVGWGDFNGDGKLDLVFAGERGQNVMFLNYGDSIGTVPYWTSGDGVLNANSLAIADVNNDGKLDLAISDNNQLGGTGKFKIYLNSGITLATTPFWTSFSVGYSSGIMLADIDNDGSKDIICGGWWKPCYIFKNQGGTFTTNPQWTSATSSVVEEISCGDYDNDGLQTFTNQFTSDGIKKLYYISKYPAHKMLFAKFGIDTVAVNQYVYDLENGWITFKNPPQAGTSITIKFIASYDLDFAVSNWDSSIGNYIFKNNIIVNVKNTGTSVPVSSNLKQNYPNPFNPVTKIKFEIAPVNSISGSVLVTLKVYDILGKEVTTLVNEQLQPGSYEVIFDAGQFGNKSNLSSEVYFYQLRTGNAVMVKKMLMIK